MNDALPSPPRYFAALPLLALLAWLPIDPYWQSDDFLALHYARELGNALADFTGPQYGATDVWLFYRPLITLSFWFDQQLAGAAPYVSHLSNVLAHAVSTLLFALLARRCLDDRRAFAAAALWTCLPSHVGSLAWAVGRVDSHTTVWCLAALLLFVRQCERAIAGDRAPRWPALVCLLLALASKELAFAVPPLAVALGALAARGRPTPARLAFALRQAAPLLALFALYLGWRQFVLGRLGGYLAVDLAPWPMVRGLGEHLLNLACPWRWAPGLDRTWWWLAALPGLVAAVWAASRWRAALVLGLLFGLAAAPMAPFFADAANVHNLRYFYLPSMVLAALLASRSAGLVWLVLATLLWPLVTVRTAQRAADLETAAMHAALRREANEGAPSPMFVAGLPHQAPSGTTVQLHFGVDRMLAPPFANDPARLYALRPLATGPVFRLEAPEGIPAALPEGSTWFFAGADTFGRAPQGDVLPELLVDGDQGGLVDFSTPRLFALAGNELTFGLTTGPGRPQGYRLTLFTANGYLACLFFDHGRAGDDHGTIDARKLLAGDRDASPPLEPARFGMLGAAYLGEALPVPTTIDRDTDFPALLEAGSWQDGRFVPTTRARRLLRFRFDRGYAAWARVVQGKS